MANSFSGQQPNVLLIITDQQRADHLGCTGHPTIKTPHIDSLARTGVMARRFYAASTTCMSNRASLMTGRLPSAHGVVHNGIDLSRDHTTFVELLRDAGYATALIGKSHLQAFGYDHPNRRAWTNVNGGKPPATELQDAHKRPRKGQGHGNEWTPDWKTGTRSRVETPYYGFGHVELCTLHGDQVHGDYAHWLAQRHPDPDSLRGKENALADARYTAPQAWRTRMPEELYPSTFVGERTCEWLRNHGRQSASQPFFVQCSFPDPHHPFTPPGRFWDMYRPDDVELPGSFASRGTSALLDEIHRNTQQGASREGHAAFAVTEREAREMRALTCGMVSLIDEQVGRIMGTLHELGLAQDTVVIFTSDHGDMLGDHGVMLKGAMHFEGITRVPFIWNDPQAALSNRGQILDMPAGTLDIASTVLDRVGLSPYNGIQGSSLLPWLNGPTGNSIAARPGMVIESEPVLLPPGRSLPYRLRSLVTPEWRFTVSNDPTLCEMYRLSEDPLEQRNCWGTEPAMRGELAQQLLMEMARLADRSPLPAAVA